MPVSATEPLFASLRERIAAIGADGQVRALEEGGERGLAAALAPLGLPAADRVLGGGLRRGTLHEIRPAAPGDGAAATGFALACVARFGSAPGEAAAARAGRTEGTFRALSGLAPRTSWMWVRQDLAGRETGEPYGPGLAALGLDPARLVLVAASDARDVLRAAEEGVRCPALAAVLVEPWGDPRALDLTAVRRLALAAEDSGVAALLLRSGAHGGPSGAATRWSVAAAPCEALPSTGRLPGLGFPAFHATLERNRQQGGLGDGGSWIMEWSPDERAFGPAERQTGGIAGDPHPRPRPAAPADGPAQAPGAPDTWTGAHRRRAG